MISIIIPVFQMNKYFLDKCIDSIVSQTYKNFEILIIDDVITSYSIHYTKLYDPFLGFFINNNNTIEHIQLFFLLYTVNTIATYTYIYKSFVITSYSIHYTKLYEVVRFIK